MYDFAELRPATDALWAALAKRLADHGVSAPAVLERGRALDEVWTDPDLLLGQTCGYPLVTTLAGRVRLVATPCYGAPGCAGAWYRSAVVVRRADDAAGLADLRGRRCAVNDAASNSGMNLLRAAIAGVAGGGARFFNEVVMTGSHAASLQAVAAGDADVAAIDCVTWAHLQRLRPEQTQRLRVLAWTPATPGLPLITSLRTDAPTLGALIWALRDVAEDSSLAWVREALLLDGFEVLEVADYDVVLELERVARI
jgi:ABC-type phosphate/phosphonate transport system substrate-binding protein